MSALAQDVFASTGAQVVSPLFHSCRERLPANVTAVAFSETNDTCFAMSLGDGTIAVAEVSMPEAAESQSDENADRALPHLKIRAIDMHRVAAVAVRPFADGFVTAGQDGRILALEPSTPSQAGETNWISDELFDTEGQWIEALATHTKRGYIAFAYADTLVVLDREGKIISRTKLEHTITDIAFDAAGNRVGASHYNGVSLVQVEGGGEPSQLYWKGAHVAITLSPDDRYVVTSTQNREVHAWDLVTLQDFRMGGYPKKVRSFDWIAGEEMLACSGADVVTAWSFAGAGPGRKPPLEIGFAFGETVTAIASHPLRAYVACGFSAGNIQVGATGKGEALVAQASSGSPVTGLAWSRKAEFLVAVDRSGYVAVFTTPQDLGIR